MTEGMSSRDITQSSMSASEGEGDGDLEGMAGRVAELEELLQGKEAVVEALSAEIDHLRAEASSPNSSQSHNSSTPYRDILLVYHTKVSISELLSLENQRMKFTLNCNSWRDCQSSLIYYLTGKTFHIFSYKVCVVFFLEFEEILII